MNRALLAVWFGALAWAIIGLAARAGQFTVEPRAVLAVGTAIPLLALAARWWPPGGERPSGAVWIMLFATGALGVLVQTLKSPPPGWPSWAWFGLRVLEASVLLVAAWAVASRRPREAWFTGSALVVLSMSWIVQIAAHPTPAVDVVYVVQQAAEAVARGDNPYGVVFAFPEWMVAAGFDVTTGPYPYLPVSAVLLTIPAALFSTARIGLVLAIALVAPALRPLLGWTGALRVTLLVAAMPDTSALVVSSWIEPLLLTLLLAANTQFARAHTRSGVVWLAAAFATKHTALLAVPALLRWPAVGPRRLLQAGALAVLVVLPFVLLDPNRFAAGPLSVLKLAGDDRADSLSLPGLLTFAGIPAPWWLTPLGLIAAVLVVRRAASVSQMLVSATASMTIFYWFSSHAFYNFYWLSAGLLAAALGTMSVIEGQQTPPAAAAGTTESRRGDSNP